MKKLLVFGLLILSSFSNLSAQGIDFFHGTWEEAIEKAKAEQKVIFVDAFAVWCGPCRRMASNVFTNSRVGEFYNANFINLKMDMEAEENMTFRKAYPVSAFPTLYYIDFTGEVVQQVRGAQEVDAFIKLGETALGKIDRSEEFAEAYEAGDRSAELMLTYVEALNQAGKPSLKVSNEYLRSQEDLNSEANLRFILEAAVEADSRIFNLMIERRKEIEALVGKEAVQERILYACSNTAQKAADFKTESLLEEAQKAMRANYPEGARQFILESNLEYYLARREDQNYLKAAQDYRRKGNADDQELFRISQDLLNFFSDNSKCLKAAEKFAAAACTDTDQYQILLHYATILNDTGKREKAIDIAKQALELAEPAGRGATMQVEYFLQQLEG